MKIQLKKIAMALAIAPLVCLTISQSHAAQSVENANSVYEEPEVPVPTPTPNSGGTSNSGKTSGKTVVTPILEAPTNNPKTKPNFDAQMEILHTLANIDLTEQDRSYASVARRCDMWKGQNWVAGSVTSADCPKYDVTKIQKSTVNTDNFTLVKNKDGLWSVAPKDYKNPPNGAKLIKIGESMGYSMYDWSTSETVKVMNKKGLLPSNTAVATTNSSAVPQLTAEQQREVERITNDLLKESNKSNKGLDLLTGDKRLACEAIMCLSSAHRPGECQPSLKRYFSIHAKKPHKLAEKRKNFLKLCPTDNDKQVNQFIDEVVGKNISAGQCSAAELNQAMQRIFHEKGGNALGETKIVHNPQRIAAKCGSDWAKSVKFVCDSKKSIGVRLRSGEQTGKNCHYEDL